MEKELSYSTDKINKIVEKQVKFNTDAFKLRKKHKKLFWIKMMFHFLV